MADKKCVFITGANKGIGFETGRELGKRGFLVFIGARDPGRGQEAVHKLTAERIEATFVQIDVENRESIRKAAETVASHTQQLDVLVNNAAIYVAGDVNLLDLNPDLFERTVRTNVFGPVYVTQAFAPLLRKSTRASVINISSGLGALTADNGSTAPGYSISKTALNAVTKQMSAAFAADGVAVNSVCPGWVRTDMGGPNAHRSVAEGADSIVWLASEAPRELTGRFIRDRKPIDW